jgi:hypothetical protein
MQEASACHSRTTPHDAGRVRTRIRTLHNNWVGESIRATGPDWRYRVVSSVFPCRWSVVVRPAFAKQKRCNTNANSHARRLKARRFGEAGPVTAVGLHFGLPGPT